MSGIRGRRLRVSLPRTWPPPCSWTGRTSRSSTWCWAVTPARCGWACGSGPCGAKRGASATSRRAGSRMLCTRPTRGPCECRRRRGRVRAVAVPGARGCHDQRGEMLVPIFAEVFQACGLTRRDIGFWCSGSSDYLAGRAFSFVSAVDAIGAVPPAMESHVEMDAAWALYEAWAKVLTGEAEIALAYGFGKSSGAELRRVLALQLDPYLVAPLWPDSVSVAALQARLGLETGRWTEKDMAEVAARSRAEARSNPDAQVSGSVSAAALPGRPLLAA